MDTGPQAKKRKKERACDGCRRRKTKCDGAWMANNLCTNCIHTGKPCTYLEASKPRGPPKAYVTGLEDRLDALEALLHRIRPNVDFSHELGPPVLRDSWKAHEASQVTRKSSFTTTAALPPLSIPFQPASPAPIASPLSTHLKLNSHRPRRPRNIPDPKQTAYRDQQNLSDDESSTDSSSSSSENEPIIITSLVGRTKITLRASENDDSAPDYNIRFHGRASTAGLVEATRQFKYMHMRDTLQQDSVSPPITPDNHAVAQTRRPEYWQTPAWELAHEGAPVGNTEILRTFLDRFPPPDLAETLIQLYFRHSNLIYPLLHRPTFHRQWHENLHHHNIWFTCVCLSVFAIASRWCHDERVLPEQHVAARAENVTWKLAGCHYFEMALEIHRVRRSLFHPASLFEVQSFALMGIYLTGTSAYPAAWFIVSTGIRKAQDVGAHRKKVYRGEPNIDDEFWKRAFWHLVIFDRLGSAQLGRSCGVTEEDFDLDLPLEVDDDYWVATQDHAPFKQPSGIPSSVTVFSELIKLTQIMAFATRTLYAVDKSKLWYILVPIEREALVKQLSLAMTEWEEGVPEHLQWREKMDVSVFSYQSATLFLNFHLTRMLVHRPRMATAPLSPSEASHSELSPVSSVVADPATAICSDAARSCARIIDLQMRQGIENFHAPSIIGAAHACAAFLLLTAWKLKVQERELRKSGIVDIKPPLAQRIEEQVLDVPVFLRALEALRSRWDVVDSLLQELRESLRGLETPSSDADTPHSVLYSQPPWPHIHHHHDQSTARPPTSVAHHPPQPQASPVKIQHPITELHTFSHNKPVVHVRLPYPQDVPSDSNTHWPQPLPKPLPSNSEQFPPGAAHGRPRAVSVTAGPWGDRTLPYSSMRRTSHPNLSQRDDEYPTHHNNGQYQHHSRTPPEAPAHSIFDAHGGGGGATFGDINMHFEHQEPPPTRHVQHGYHQPVPSKYPYEFLRGASEKSGYWGDGWNVPLGRSNRFDRASWMISSETSSATPYPRLHPYHQDGRHARLPDPYNPAQSR